MFFFIINQRHRRIGVHTTRRQSEESEKRRGENTSASSRKETRESREVSSGVQRISARVRLLYVCAFAVLYACNSCLISYTSQKPSICDNNTSQKPSICDNKRRTIYRGMPSPLIWATHAFTRSSDMSGWLSSSHARPARAIAPHQYGEGARRSSKGRAS